MAKDAGRWTLEDLIDFECEVAAATRTAPELREEVLAAARGLEGAAARRAGFRVWLTGTRGAADGAKFVSALGMVGSGLVLLMFLAGVSGVLGMVNIAKGVHVVMFLAILLGTQWLILVLAGLAWAFRSRAAEGFSAVQAVLAVLARRLAGGHAAPWWSNLMHEGGAAREALLWRVARIAQAAGISFNLGLISGLAGLVMLRHVGFFWETTTELAMHSLLEKLCRFLSLPWAAWLPSAVPDAAVIADSRWFPDRGISPSPVWWRFLLMATLVWGLLPRLFLWFLAWNACRRALGSLDFQARSHRALWRELTSSDRAETDDKPLDGVLVLDVGGSGMSQESLRPYLLRRLRVHPSAWLPVAVLDPGAEAEVARALAAAPAGVVLLAEGWSLSPARMAALHARVRAVAGSAAPISFLIANCGPDQSPQAPSPDEQREWERFVDSLRDPEAEVFSYAHPQPVA
jgi:hypothetical protein